MTIRAPICFLAHELQGVEDLGLGRDRPDGLCPCNRGCPSPFSWPFPSLLWRIRRFCLRESDSTARRQQLQGRPIAGDGLSDGARRAAPDGRSSRSSGSPSRRASSRFAGDRRARRRRLGRGIVEAGDPGLCRPRSGGERSTTTVRREAERGRGSAPRRAGQAAATSGRPAPGRSLRGSEAVIGVWRRTE